MISSRRQRANQWLAVMSQVLLLGAHLLDSTAAVTTKPIRTSSRRTRTPSSQRCGSQGRSSSLHRLLSCRGSMLVAERPGPPLYRPTWIGHPAPEWNSPGSVCRTCRASRHSLDPAFATNAIVYLSYAHGTEEASVVRVTRAHLDLQNGTLTDPQMIFESAPPATRPQLMGGRIALTPDGHLFPHARRSAGSLARAGSFRSRRIDHSHSYGRLGSGGQPFCFRPTREAGDLELWPSQPAGARVRPPDRPTMVS